MPGTDIRDGPHESDANRQEFDRRVHGELLVANWSLRRPTGSGLGTIQLTSSSGPGSGTSGRDATKGGAPLPSPSGSAPSDIGGRLRAEARQEAEPTQGFEPRGLLAPIVGPMMGGTILKTFTSVLTGLKQKAEVRS